MNNDSRKLMKLFYPFGKIVHDYTQQYETEKKVPAYSNIAEKFQQNREQDLQEGREFYDKAALINEQRKVTRQREHQQGKPERQNISQETARMEINTQNGAGASNVKQDFRSKSGKLTKKDKDNKSLQHIKHVQQLKQQSYQNDQQAQEKLKDVTLDHALRKIRGETVKDDEQRIRKAQREQQQLKAKRAQKWEAQKDDSKQKSK